MDGGRLSLVGLKLMEGDGDQEGGVLDCGSWDETHRRDGHQWD